MKSADTPYGDITADEREAIGLVSKSDGPVPDYTDSDKRIAYWFRSLASTRGEDFMILFSGCKGYIAGLEAERARAARSAKVHAALVECSVALRNMVCTDGDLLRTNEAFASALYGEASSALARLEAAQKEAQP